MQLIQLDTDLCKCHGSLCLQALLFGKEVFILLLLGELSRLRLEIQETDDNDNNEKILKLRSAKKSNINAYTCSKVCRTISAFHMHVILFSVTDVN